MMAAFKKFDNRRGLGYIIPFGLCGGPDGGNDG